MRVAFLVTAFPTVSETFILDQITGLVDRGVEVEIFAAQPEQASATHPEVESYGLRECRHLSPMPESYVQRPVRAVRLALSRRHGSSEVLMRSLNCLRYGALSASLRLFFESAAWAGERPFDVIHCHFGPNGLRGLALREIGALRGKLITSFYGYDVSSYLSGRRRNPYARLFAEGDLFIAISDVMRRKLIEEGCPPERIIVHRLGVRTGLFSATSALTPDRSAMQILTIGRMVPKKGMEDGLRAVAALIRERPPHERPIEYVILGDGPLRPRIEQMAAELGIADCVHLPGWKSRPEIVSALKAADVLLAPSITGENGDQEGTPVVIMEALASGVPVVSTRHAGIPEVVEDGTSGYLVREGEVSGLRDALCRLLRDGELRARFGRQGRMATEERHDADKLNDRLAGVYRDIVHHGTVSGRMGQEMSLAPGAGSRS